MIISLGSRTSSVNMARVNLKSLPRTAPTLVANTFLNWTEPVVDSDPLKLVSEIVNSGVLSRPTVFLYCARLRPCVAYSIITIYLGCRNLSSSPRGRLVGCVQ